MEIAYNIFHLS
uniref:Uncharacterized protein n=1 Tax=Lepeophtheirus salmonis TaxID=72036 RepID=A0A0K2UY54_LEPSM